MYRRASDTSPFSPTAEFLPETKKIAHEKWALAGGRQSPPDWI